MKGSIVEAKRGTSSAESQSDEELAQNQADVVEANLAQLIKICSRSAGPLTLDGNEIDDGFRVQHALRELGQHVNVSTAVRVWQHYSNSILAGWLTGADTIESAKKAIYRYCLNTPPGGLTPEPPGPAGFD
ncbi:MAG: hypothetical protein Q7U74_15550 [Saprospiraceae bacterium]|nr:hypothetical protein [Saprospiraceae bacterium]